MSCATIRSSISAVGTPPGADHIGLVHISGIARNDLAPDALTEPDRGLIFIDDRVGNIAQLRLLLAAGYSGFVSVEPFSPHVQNDPDLPRICAPAWIMWRRWLKGLEAGAAVGCGLPSGRKR